MVAGKTGKGGRQSAAQLAPVGGVKEWQHKLSRWGGEQWAGPST